MDPQGFKNTNNLPISFPQSSNTKYLDSPNCDIQSDADGTGHSRPGP